MNVIKFLKGATFGLACLGMIVPQTVMAAGPQTTQNAKVQIADVSLTNGVLTGKVVNAQGQLQAGSVVKVSLGNKEVATVVAGQNGDFAVQNLHSGVYQVSTGQTSAAVRLWDGQAAPPLAKKNILLVNSPLTRAQCNSCNTGGLSAAQLGIGALAATAVVLGAVAISDNGDTIIVSP